MYFLKHKEKTYISNGTGKINAGTSPFKHCWVKFISIVEMLLNHQIKYVTFSDSTCTKYISGYLWKRTLWLEDRSVGLCWLFYFLSSINMLLSDLYTSISCEFSQCESSNTSDLL